MRKGQIYHLTLLLMCPDMQEMLLPDLIVYVSVHYGHYCHLVLLGSSMNSGSKSVPSVSLIVTYNVCCFVLDMSCIF